MYLANWCNGGVSGWCDSRWFSVVLSVLWYRVGNGTMFCESKLRKWYEECEMTNRNVIPGVVFVALFAAISWWVLKAPVLDAIHQTGQETFVAEPTDAVGSGGNDLVRASAIDQDQPTGNPGAQANPRYLSIVATVKSQDVAELSPAGGAIVWLSHWVDPHVNVPSYATRLEEGRVLSERGIADFLLESDERATVVVEYFGQRKRVQIAPETRPSDGIVRVTFKPAASVVGIVRLNGAPLSGATVLLMPDIDGSAVPVKWVEAETGGAGQFAIPSAPPGNWRLEVRSEKVSGWRSDTVQLREGVENLVKLEIRGLGEREVFVRDSDGEPVYNATVSLSGPDWELYGPVDTDQFGVASFFVPHGLVVDASVRSRPPAGMAYPLYKGWDGVEPPRVAIQLMPCDQSIRGVVSFGDRRATGGVVGATQQGLLPVTASVSAEDGTFSMDGLLPDTLTTLRYSSDGMESSKLFRVTPNSQDYFVEMAFADSLVRVTTRDKASGLMLANCPFVITDSEGRRIPNTLGTSTDAKGSRKVSGLESGDYRIAVGPAIHGKVRSGSHGTVVREFRIQGAGEQLNLNIDLPPKGRELMLRVLDEQEQAVKGASVFVAMAGLPLATFDLFGTSANGTTQLAGLPDTDFELVVVKPGFGTARKVITVISSNSVVEMRMAQGRAVQLHLPASMVSNPKVFSSSGASWDCNLDLLSVGHGQARKSGYHQAGDREFEIVLSPGEYCVTWGSKLQGSRQQVWNFTVEPGNDRMIVDIPDAESH
jgi:hypothetical protein